MKKILFLIIFNFLFFCSSNVKEKKIQTDCYFITKINDEDSFYVIYAKNHLGSHKIISMKTESKCEEKIKIGSSYCLKTKSIFTIGIKQNDTIITIQNNLNIDCMTIENISFCKEYDNNIFDVLITENLSGLCLNKNH
jgi:hypothetical protein